MSEHSVQSTRWQWGDLFSADVPDNWTVKELDDVIEMAPAGSVGALHITFLRRSGQDAVQSGEAAALLSRFAEGRNGEIALEGEHWGDSVLIATGSMLEQPKRGAALVWDLQAQVWDEGAIITTYCHDGNHRAERQEALSILSSLRPGS